MTQVLKQPSTSDIAYQLLQKQGQAMYFKDLITEALQASGKRVYSLAQAIAEVHTQINMDSRFAHAGKGMWGLAEWSPQQQKINAAEAAGKTVVDMRRSRLLEEIQVDHDAHLVEEPEEEFSESE